MNDEIVLKMENITKVYNNGVVANKDVCFNVKKGEIHALMGENGAGKSTLMKILYGIERPESGTISLNGKAVSIPTTAAAINLGIGMVHQHFMLVPSLSVCENIVLGYEPVRFGFMMNLGEARAKTVEISKRYNLTVNPDDIVADLSVGIKQKIEILKALIRNVKILILDEPTAVLTPQETRELFAQLKKLKEDGYTIIFISHKLGEIKEICDRITVMRAGHHVATCDVADVTTEDISRMMVGRDVVMTIEKAPPKPTETVLEVKNLSHKDENGKNLLNNVSLKVRRGEIVGIAGVEGNGQRELVDIITGLTRARTGDVSLHGKAIATATIRQRRDAHMAHIPEDRMTLGAAADVSIKENLISDRVSMREFNNGILLNSKSIDKLADDIIAAYRIKTDSPDRAVGMLSGGNIQKVVVGRELSSKPDLVVADQPSRGIDIGATRFIYEKLIEMRDNGCAILLISADINEVLELSDSLIVMYGGEIVAWFEDVKDLDEEELGLYMLGLKKQGGAANA